MPEGRENEPRALDHRATITQRLAAHLTQRIVAGSYAPGAPLREGALVAEFDVSRHVIREVLRTLAADGLLDYSSFKGARIPIINEASARDIYRGRRLVECGSESMTPLPDPQIVRRIHSHFSKAVETAAWADAFELDLAFHGAIVGARGSIRLSEWQQKLSLELRLAHLVAPEFNLRTWVCSVEQHGEIVAAIVAGEAAGARDAMRRHLDDAERTLLAEMAQAHSGAQLPRQDNPNARRTLSET